MTGQQRVERSSVSALGGTQVALAPSPLSGSSVWIDPSVSAFLGGHVVDAGLPIPPAGISHSKKVSPSPIELGPRKPQPNPITPIPPSAQPPNNVQVQPKYTRSDPRSKKKGDVTSLPIVPPQPMWQYESPSFEVESSLSALSLVIDAPTHPEPTPSSRSTRRLPPQPEIDEIDTVPPAPRRAQHSTANDEIEIIPFPGHGTGISVRSLVEANDAPVLPFSTAKALVPVPHQPVSMHGQSQVEQKRLKLASENTDPASWTAGGASSSAYARRIAERGRPKGRKPKADNAFNLLDHLRWWLLHPGRLEFILWLGGTILLVSVTFVLLLITALNFVQITPVLIGQGGLIGGTSSSPGSNQNGTGKPTMVTTTSGLTLILLDTGPLVPGQSIQLQGKGFTPQGAIIFTDEKNNPMLILNTQFNSAEADKQGAFAVTINDAAWTPGHHFVVVRDVATGRVVELPVVLATGPFGKQGSTPLPGTPQPGLTPTPTQNSGFGGIPTPVNFTPVVTPTRPVTNTPTPTPQPTQSPTPTPQPTQPPTPTPGITPTITPSPAASPAQGTPLPTSSPAQGNVGVQFMVANVGSASLHSNSDLGASWLWLLITGYSISMLMLGMAGVLHKHRR
jgi:hypothetical protein